MNEHILTWGVVFQTSHNTLTQADLVGFREENVLQVSSYYRADVQVNYLAELVTDSSVRVKESVVELLREFMTVMGDRYDHQTRYVMF
jgi:hypothetical protein